ncbi:hypothetical protein [Pseudomonas mosselii]|uniref:hypothetical protein n=1 Tax=Pseudomonas mosselii TaxID=78327 RepID=UPI0021DAE429|nr:hypothetical protein [Pseudomonas mosselii]MCU9527528.1 hypothetical protein [Pseudomonas mosselii]MCU9534841.1 hypothetical protein [Pseudomonas mosselii]MCU9542775.1 hypothetical protein [Pseudomonas mosselii]MCU9546681.1 hypothetical protein [Pseudomonas mosselii]
MSIVGEDGFPPRVKEDLRRDVGGYCSAPFCGDQTAVYDRSRRKDRLTGDAAHICGAKRGAARYWDLPEGMDRHGYDNGIWLCAVCHRMVDNSAELFPADMLDEWKYLAIKAHQEGGRTRRFALNVGSDLSRDHHNAVQFLNETSPIIEGYRNALFQVRANSSYGSRVRLDNEVTFKIRSRAGLYVAKRWNAHHPHWVFTPDLRQWQDEIVRLATVLSDMPGIRLSDDNVIDMYHTLDEGRERVFTDPTAAALFVFVKMIERFEIFLRDYKGPQQSFGFTSKFQF